MHVLISRKIEWFLKLFAITCRIDACNTEDKPWSLYLYCHFLHYCCSMKAKDHIFNGFPGFWSKLFLAFTEHLIISNTKQRKFKTIAQGNCHNKNGKMFPCCPVYYYFHGLQLDKLSEYALTEVKHRFSGKRRVLSTSLQAISFY